MHNLSKYMQIPCRLGGPGKAVTVVKSQAPRPSSLLLLTLNNHVTSQAEDFP